MSSICPTCDEQSAAPVVLWLASAWARAQARQSKLLGFQAAVPLAESAWLLLPPWAASRDFSRCSQLSYHRCGRRLRLALILQRYVEEKKYRFGRKLVTYGAQVLILKERFTRRRMKFLELESLLAKANKIS
jgi:hypothetical protein